jgi:hypothetical protein
MVPPGNSLLLLLQKAGGWHVDALSLPGMRQHWRYKGAPAPALGNVARCLPAVGASWGVAPWSGICQPALLI